jgi:hypothetical protein
VTGVRRFEHDESVHRFDEDQPFGSAERPGLCPTALHPVVAESAGSINTDFMHYFNSPIDANGRIVVATYGYPATANASGNAQLVFFQ